MKKFLLLFLLTLGTAYAQVPFPSGQPYQVLKTTTCTSASCVPIGTNGNGTATGGFPVADGVGFYNLSWTIDGTVSTCAVSIDSDSNLGAAWSTGGVASSGTIGSCATSGSYSNTTGVFVNFARITTTITGTGNVTFTLVGRLFPIPALATGGTLTGVTAGNGINVSGGSPSPTVNLLNPFDGVLTVDGVDHSATGGANSTNLCTGLKYVNDHPTVFIYKVVDSLSYDSEAKDPWNDATCANGFSATNGALTYEFGNMNFIIGWGGTMHLPNGAVTITHGRGSEAQLSLTNGCGTATPTQCSGTVFAAYQTAAPFTGSFAMTCPGCTVFPTSTPGIDYAGNGVSSFGTQLNGPMTITMAGIAGSTCVQNTGAQENSSIRDVTCAGAQSLGIDVSQSTAQNFHMGPGIEIISGLKTGATIGTPAAFVGVKWSVNGPNRDLDNVTCNPRGAATTTSIAACVEIVGPGGSRMPSGHVHHVHTENVKIAVLVDGGRNIEIDNINTGSATQDGGTPTAMVYICGAASPVPCTTGLTSSKIRFHTATIISPSLMPNYVIDDSASPSITVTAAQWNGEYNTDTAVAGKGTLGQPAVYTGVNSIASLPQTMDAAACSGADILAQAQDCATKLGAAGGTIIIDPGTYNSVTSTLTINQSNISVLCPGGQAATVINYTGTGDAIRVFETVFTVQPAGFFQGCSIIGTASGSSGLHISDTIGFTIQDSVFRGFTGASGSGVWFDNIVNWTERTKLLGVTTYNDTLQYRFTVNGGTNSFGYTRMLDARCNIQAASQVCISAENNSFLYASSLRLTANVNAAGTVIHTANTALVQDNEYDITAETNQTGVSLATVDSGTTLTGTGTITGQHGSQAMSINNNGVFHLAGIQEPNNNQNFAEYSFTDHGLRFYASNNPFAALFNNNWRISSAATIGWSTGVTTTANDTAFSRHSANAVDCGNGTLNDQTCTLNASIFAAGTGSGSAPSFANVNAPTYGMSFPGNNSIAFYLASAGAYNLFSTSFRKSSGVVDGWSSGGATATALDTGMSRDAAATIDFGNGTASDKTAAMNFSSAVLNGATGGNKGAGTINVSGGFYVNGANINAPATVSTATNCSSSASPAVCAAAPAGSVAVPTGTNPTLVVNTTAVTANSQIFVQSDDSLGTKLSVTCNSTLTSLAVEPVVTARVAATSFTVQISGVISTNAVCLSYFIVN